MAESIKTKRRWMTRHFKKNMWSCFFVPERITIIYNIKYQANQAIGVSAYSNLKRAPEF